VEGIAQAERTAAAGKKKQGNTDEKIRRIKEKF